jgi:hypothetical protein
MHPESVCYIVIVLLSLIYDPEFRYGNRLRPQS